MRFARAGSAMLAAAKMAAKTFGVVLAVIGALLGSLCLSANGGPVSGQDLAGIVLTGLFALYIALVTTWSLLSGLIAFLFPIRRAS